MRGSHVQKQNKANPTLQFRTVIFNRLPFNDLSHVYDLMHNSFLRVYEKPSQLRRPINKPIQVARPVFSEYNITELNVKREKKEEKEEKRNLKQS